MTKVARYHRVSTEDQSLARQTSATEEYVQDTWDNPESLTLADADTGTNTDRESYQRLMSMAESGEIDAAVVKDMSRISRSMKDLLRTVEQFRESGVELHFIDDPIDVRPDENDPMQEFMLNILGAVAEHEAKITQQRVREGIAARQELDDYHWGQPPIGFEKKENDKGTLYEQSSGPQAYQRVRTVLHEVSNGDMSKRQAAKELDCTRATIRNAIEDRGELYGL